MAQVKRRFAVRDGLGRAWQVEERSTPPDPKDVRASGRDGGKTFWLVEGDEQLFRRDPGMLAASMGDRVFHAAHADVP